MELICKHCGHSERYHQREGHPFEPFELTHTGIAEIDNKIGVEEFETSELERELASVLNKYSAENGSNTPDFILAEYLIGCLKAFNTATKSAHAWRGLDYLNVGTTDSNP